jgi:Cu+-exporting ATPase
MIFGALFAPTVQRGAADPVCGMTVDRSKAPIADHDGRTFYFCSEHCREQFLADPDGFTRRDGRPLESVVAEHAHHG